MSLIDILTNTNNILVQITLIIPTFGYLCAALAVFIPESAPIIGPILHKIGLNIGKAENK